MVLGKSTGSWATPETISGSVKDTIKFQAGVKTLPFWALNGQKRKICQVRGNHVTPSPPTAGAHELDIILSLAHGFVDVSSNCVCAIQRYSHHVRSPIFSRINVASDVKK